MLAVTVVLTSLLFPAFRGVRASAMKLACASNQRQIVTAMGLWANDHNDRLPPSTFAAPGQLCMPQEMMAATRGGAPAPPTASIPGVRWEGIGWLLSPTTGSYLDTPVCLYCPCHHGDHPFERYQDIIEAPGNDRIYTNYHYAGDREIGSDDLVLFGSNPERVLLSDGLRTLSDFNHNDGANILRGDGSVEWFADVERKIRDALPDGQLDAATLQIELYKDLWSILTQDENVLSPQ